MKSELICPNCNEKLDVATSDELIFINCMNIECDYEERVIDMTMIS
ncbi:hypothetical protein P5815_30475 [Bacillus cereus]|nr:hypothetical protein [Bacillus cereus]MDF9524826.1 hypothetical protein [Bacillus cereus]MDF9564505.1 hypothetical protein [Bacillus cereus]